MKGATKTRTQRRMEKKQALLLLVLVLVASLASFTLGVIVGQRGATRELVLKQQAAEKILVAPAPARPAAVPVPPAAQAEQKVAGQAKEETKLTFYDDLNKQSVAPLGSGINLPPAEQKPEAATKPPLDLPAQPIVKKGSVAAAEKSAPQATKAEAAVADTALIMPKVDPQGKYVLQVGSFAAAGDAGKVKQRLLNKHYPAFVAEADLGKKGTWYRVRLGPYADSEAAKTMQQLLEKQEQMKGFVTRK